MPYPHETSPNGSRQSQASHNSKSFSRIEPKTSSPLRSRASTLSYAVPHKPANADSTDMMAEVNTKLEEDIFDKTEVETHNITNNAQTLSPVDVPEGFDDLPIELVSLIDRYIYFRFLIRQLLTSC